MSRPGRLARADCVGLSRITSDLIGLRQGGIEGGNYSSSPMASAKAWAAPFCQPARMCP